MSTENGPNIDPHPGPKIGSKMLSLSCEMFFSFFGSLDYPPKWTSIWGFFGAHTMELKWCQDGRQIWVKNGPERHPSSTSIFTQFKCVLMGSKK